MIQPKSITRHFIRAMAILGIVIGVAGVAGGREKKGQSQPVYRTAFDGAQLKVVAGKSLSLMVPHTIERISVAAPEVADVVTISTRELLAIGKKPGATNVVIWDKNGTRSIFHLAVHADTGNLIREIETLYPEEKLNIRSVNDTIVLSGTTRRLEVKKAVGQVAESFAPKKVVNLIEVTSPDQISLKVRIAEVARSAMRELGLGFVSQGRLGAEPGELGVFPGAPLFQPFGSFRRSTTTSDGFTFPQNSPPIGPDLGFSSLVNFFIADSTRKLGLFIRALENKGDLKTLAEPRLVTQSGQKANFLVGGEFPIPIPQAGAGGSITIEFKPFGVRLEFLPQLKGKDRDLIELQLKPEVSELDFSQAIVIAGFTIPTLTKRRAETVVELKNRQTFAVAGLIQNRLQKGVDKVPWLGNIPILGTLFTSPRFQRNETELLVLVTPEIMKHVKTDDPMPLKRGVNLGRGM